LPPVSRRQFLRYLVAGGAFATGAMGIEAGRKVHDYIEQQATWDEASLPTEAFFERHADRLARLRLGGSFAPEEWFYTRPPTDEVVQAFRFAVHDLGLKQMRLGIRWSRADRNGAPPELESWAPILDAAFEEGADLTLNLGPIRTFRFPEEQPPGRLLNDPTAIPPVGARVQLSDRMAQEALTFLDLVIEKLHRQYGSALDAYVHTIQIENEPYYPLGEHRWQMTQPYILEVAERVMAGMPGKSLLVTSAGRLNLDSIRDLFEKLLRRHPDLRGKLVGGFDFHYRTPARQSYPLIRYLDQIGYATPFAPSLSRNIWDSRDMGYTIEVTEGQMEPFAQFPQPGNQARELRYLLLRCLDHVLDPERPGLIRLWGVETLTKRMLKGDLTSEHREIIDIIQRINAPHARLRDA
jgi:hypothetical protein